MLVRVYDKENNLYFKSEAYAILNSGCYEQYVILVPDEQGGFFRLFNSSNITKTNDYMVYINVITPKIQQEWVFREKAALTKINEVLSDNSIKFYSFYGYERIFEQTSLVVALLRGETVRADFMGFRPVYSRLEGWHYIETQADIDALLDATFEFHDSCLECLSYKSGSYVSEDKSMHPIDDIRTLQMIFGSQLCDSIELIFDGLLDLNLRPAGDGYSSEIGDASLRLKDEIIYFTDGEWDLNDCVKNSTCVEALSLRWRFFNRRKSNEHFLERDAKKT